MNSFDPKSSSFYDPALSSTYKYIAGQPFHLAYGDGSVLNGHRCAAALTAALYSPCISFRLVPLQLTCGVFNSPGSAEDVVEIGGFGALSKFGAVTYAPSASHSEFM